MIDAETAPLQEFDTLAASETERARRMLSAECSARLADILALRLAGVRSQLAMWTPRPALTAEEMPAWRAEVQSIVVHLVDEVVAALLKERDVAGVYAKQRMTRWNAEREVNRPPKPWEVRAQLEGAPKSRREPNEMERVEDADGKFHFEYDIRPSAEDVQAEQRAQRDRERRANRTDTTTP